MTAEHTRWQFPAARSPDPARAVADLADTIPLVDDLAAVLARFDPTTMTDCELEDWHTLRHELLNLRRRLEAIHARLT